MRSTVGNGPRSTGNVAATCFKVLVTGLVIVVALSIISMVSLRQRENARVVGCTNNLRIIGLASVRYTESRGYLPACSIGYERLPQLSVWVEPNSQMSWKNAQNTSSLGQIVPFMESQSFEGEVDSLAFDRNRNLSEQREAGQLTWQADIPGALQAATTLIPQWLCPADSFDDFLGETIVASQQVVNVADPNNDLGLQTWAEADPQVSEGQLRWTNYQACGGAVGGSWQFVAECRGWQGAMLHQKTKVSSIIDGLSTTILYAEALGEIKQGERELATSWFWAGCVRGRGALPFKTEASSGQLMLGDTMTSSIYGFGSKHVGGINIGTADGSTRLINRDVSVEVFYRLCAAGDQMQPF